MMKKHYFTFQKNSTKICGIKKLQKRHICIFCLMLTNTQLSESSNVKATPLT